MGRRGPAPMPSKLRLLAGNPSKRPMPRNEPQPTGGPDMPAFVTGAAALEWTRVIGSMPPGFFTSADVPVLSVYCLSWVQYRNALAQVAREGAMAAGSMGQRVAHPAVAVAANLAELILRTGDRLGMSPAARARLEVPDQPAASKFDGLIGGKPRGDLRLVT